MPAIRTVLQVPGINLEDGDTIRNMSASDSATAVLSKMHHVFVCTDFIVRHIRYVCMHVWEYVCMEVCTICMYTSDVLEHKWRASFLLSCLKLQYDYMMNFACFFYNI